MDHTPNDLELALLNALRAFEEEKAEAHCSHCVWIEEQIETQKARRQLFLSMANFLIQASVLGIVGTIWAWTKGHISWHF